MAQNVVDMASASTRDIAFARINAERALQLRSLNERQPE